MSSSEDNKRIVRHAYAAMSGGDVKRFLAVLDDDVVVYEPDALPYGGVYEGRSVFVASLPAAGALLDASRLVVEDLVAEGDKVVALIRVAVRGGVPDALVTEHWTMREGKAIELRVFWYDPTQVPVS
jgi:ketosteroid isomerase-like protein